MKSACNLHFIKLSSQEDHPSQDQHLSHQYTANENIMVLYAPHIDVCQFTIVQLIKIK